MQGKCLCGAVTVTLPRPVTEVDACHCGMCRTLCGGGPMFALHAAGGVRPTVDGEESLRTYRSSEWAERVFCGICGTPIWYRFIADDFHSLAAGLFPPEALTLTKQIFIEAKPALYDLANETPKLTEAEVIAEYTAEKAKHEGSAP
ncbi:MAG: GFA family protein [Paracoccaceae bacterium]